MYPVKILLPRTTFKNAAFNAEIHGVDVAALCSVILTDYFDPPDDLDEDEDPFGAPTSLPPGTAFNLYSRRRGGDVDQDSGVGGCSGS
jgi:hypothetical protein